MADYAANPKAHHDYEILETLEAGLVLLGSEVKSVRAGRAQLKGAYVRILNGVPLLIGAHIPPYQPGNTATTYREQTDRKLLLSKQQISTLLGLQQAHGVTLIPLRLYDKKGHIKLEIGIARGKKKYDKRETIKQKDIARARQRGTSEE